ncbi:DUF4382 domain-containing protein [Shewanella sp. CG12_big_fil_rev_8_21_14_0_65_47_15]|uniref:DUF4382 domain-containing protein n=1 Tax=Shewanella sp. CG12_big_fil_rev_8_21_14_0_65_47_15 TaxID=1975537 RepID=UPI000CAE6380|nr:DUF4382 domain-containing protein [Shewanella sp. CG12_big_fil_rev_8_21_14_0_65_47_15]PIW62310.1 MAG: hypothetical protein COW15_04100 [Shewanella sp. CG12_big_fil_rev_8_21_14_0_65_47_15]
MRHISLLLIPTILLSACGGSDSSNDPIADAKVGTVNIAISDSPMSEVSKVELVLDQLVMTDEHNHVYTYDMGHQRFNLLDYPGMASHKVISDLQLPAGHYHSVHFTLVNGDEADGCAIENGHGRLPLMVEDGHLPLRDFVLNEHDNLSFTMEIDLYRSMHFSDHQYQLNHNGIYSVDDRYMGHLNGEMDPQWIADCEIANAAKAPFGGQFYHMAYLYQDNVTGIEQMADIRSDKTDGKFSPVAVSPIHQDRNGDWSFAIGYLPVGNYRVGYTCLGHLDDPAQDDIHQSQFSLFKDAGSVAIAEGGQATTHRCGNGHGGRG